MHSRGPRLTSCPSEAARCLLLLDVRYNARNSIGKVRDSGSDGARREWGEVEDSRKGSIQLILVWFLNLADVSARRRKRKRKGERVVISTWWRWIWRRKRLPLNLEKVEMIVRMFSCKEENISCIGFDFWIVVDLMDEIDCRKIRRYSKESITTFTIVWFWIDLSKQRRN